MNFLITLFSFFISFVATATNTTTFAYDQMGLEIQRLLPGQVQQTTTRDALGRPTEQLTGHASKRQRSRKYNWTTSNRLTQIIDSATGTTHFDYNKEGYLTQAKYADGSTTNRYPDAKGNLYEDANLKDREYTHGGKLIKKGSWHYKYNHQGFLVEKYKKTGSLFSFKEDQWYYDWNSAGLLEAVKRPDGFVIKFGYDALGRRIWKNYKQTTTHWHWDGNVPLHEWKGFVSKDALSENLITWVFEEDSFSPIAKVKGNKYYSILADHLGTPIEMYQDDGSLFWERELNANGKTIKETQQGSCPFLFQGQYYDAEIELAYNRFRYYDVEDGRYISQDPIGLLSGEFGFYNHVEDPLTWLDIFGLKSSYSVYVLKKDGKIVYYGITKQKPKSRKNQHKNGSKKVPKKDFDEMVVIDSGLTRRQARNIEGSALHHADGDGLDNLTRNDGQYYHSYNKNPGKGRQLVGQDVINDKIANGTIVN
ncbi:RHS repeat-associated core domain-containing protein [Flavobacterium branchiophilum]|uniref:RHS repeat domain-containing protein n=1 Tax=Flavobacterium branchiophilum TaxID=55197 RepID=UPI00031CE38C|nr:RHS repeat-associated core domain-containing protein [Flavobacterium branchiophilum]